MWALVGIAEHAGEALSPSINGLADLLLCLADKLPFRAKSCGTILTASESAVVD